MGEWDALQRRTWHRVRDLGDIGTSPTSSCAHFCESHLMLFLNLGPSFSFLNYLFFMSPNRTLLHNLPQFYACKFSPNTAFRFRMHYYFLLISLRLSSNCLIFLLFYTRFFQVLKPLKTYTIQIITINNFSK